MRPIGRLSIKKQTPRDRPTKGTRSIPREPYDEPLTPGLRKNVQTEAIGFLDFTVADDDEDGDWD